MELHFLGLSLLISIRKLSEILPVKLEMFLAAEHFFTGSTRGARHCLRKRNRVNCERLLGIPTCDEEAVVDVAWA